MGKEINLNHIYLKGFLYVTGTTADIESFLLDACHGKLSNGSKKIVVKSSHIKGTHAGYIGDKVSFTFKNRSESLEDRQEIRLPYSQKTDINAVDLQKLSNKYNIDFSRYIEVVGGKINKNYCKYCGY